MQSTTERLVTASTDFPRITRQTTEILQVNLGYLCNLSCTHCHVNAGPKRTELMDKETIDLVLEILETQSIRVLDVTGGAPEMNPHFRDLVRAARNMGVQVIDRCNLTILQDPDYAWLAGFLAEQRVHVVASLPCYLEDNVDAQRGKGVYQDSIAAIKQLNALGYGQQDTGLVLDLVYNPTGPFLPPNQQQLEADYKRELDARFGLQFNYLLTITNMPISRFGAVLLAHEQFDDYMQLLRDNFDRENLASVMCRAIVSVDYQGYLYDCDFNQMLKLPLGNAQDTAKANTSEQDKSEDFASAHWHLRDLLAQDVTRVPIKVADHCFGCTAGQGSSCSGALA